MHTPDDGRSEPRFGAYGSVPDHVPPSWGPALPAPPAGLAGAMLGLGGAWVFIQLMLWWNASGTADAYVRAVEQGIDPLTVSTPQDAWGMPLVLVQLALFVVGGMWLWRSRQFAVALHPEIRHVRGPVWVWIGWLVPFVSLWFPYQVVRDVRAGTVGSRGGQVGAWWAAWLASQIMAAQASLVTVGLVDARSLPMLELMSFLTLTFAFVLWVRVVGQVSAAQRARLA